MKPKLALAAVIIVAVVVSTSGGAAPKNDLSDFMRVKLKNSQEVLEGLVLDDFEKIAKNAQNMSLLSLAENWQVLQTPQYIEYSRKFRKDADALADAAKHKNLDEATKAYNRVTTRCVECHKYLRDVRMARAD
jgi:cytochrome c556